MRRQFPADPTTGPPTPLKEQVIASWGSDPGGILAPEPTVVSELCPGVLRFTWEPSTSSGHAVVIVPGWGAHPAYYGGLVRSLLDESRVVFSCWAPHADRSPASHLHYTALRSLLSFARDSTEGAVFTVAESLGATYLLSAGAMNPNEECVLIAPGLIVRWSQVLSKAGLRDAKNLISSDRLPLLGWRAETISHNPAFVQLLRCGGLTPDFSDRDYVLSAAVAATKALASPHVGQHAWILQGEKDRLASPLGARMLARRLGRDHATLTVLPEVDHGILWDDRAAKWVLSYINDRIRAFYDRDDADDFR